VRGKPAGRSECPQGGSMNYGEWHKVFEIKVKGYDAFVCEHAIKDCHDTLALHKDMATDNPYYVKLWAEIDALRERQMKLKVAA
jgi:hypothetical protein